MFGVQWDLVLKYIEMKFVEKNSSSDIKTKLLSNSTIIGNYYNSEFILSRGKFAQYVVLSDWFDYNSEEKKDVVTECKKKIQSSNSNAILLTTGATEASNLQNIYDIAGNVCEWTFEKTSDDDIPGANRGGSYDVGGSDYSASSRGSLITSVSNYNVGFRVSLY